MKIFRKIVPIMILSLLASQVLLLQSCGDQPPYGSSITVEAIGSIDYYPDIPASDPTNATKTQNYRVTVLDEDGFPMNGIKVDVFGTIDSNSVIDFFGSAPPPATSFSEKTGKWGFLDFAVVAHVYTPLILNAPTTVTATGSTSGGGITIPQSSTQTICYGVSVIDATAPTPQETGISSPVCAAITNSTITGITVASVTIAWSSVYGASGYRVYRTSATAGTGLTIGRIGSTTTILSFLDNGMAASGAVPAIGGSITSNTGNNSISGTITVTSGASIGTLDISF